MREIPKKNYFILAGILLITVLVTLGLSAIYKNVTKETNEFYEYSNSIDSNEFEEYILEKESYFIYISDKYNEEVQKFEKDFENKIIETGLHDNYIYMDKSELSKTVKEKINSMSDTEINYKNYPLIIVIEDNKVNNIIYVDINAYDIDTLLNYEELK